MYYFQKLCFSACSLSSQTFPKHSIYNHFLIAASLYILINPVLKKGDCSNPSNYQLIALTYCLSKPFETVINKNILQHLSDHNLQSNHQYEFCNGLFTGNLLAFLTESLTDFSNAIALDMTKAFDRVWCKALISKPPSYRFYPFLCNFILGFLSDQSIAASVYGRCSCKPNNSGIPQDFVLLPLLFIIHQ